MLQKTSSWQVFIHITLKHATSAAQHVIELDSIIHLYLDQKQASRSCTVTYQVCWVEELNKVIWYRREKQEEERKMSGVSLLVYLLRSSHMWGYVPVWPGSELQSEKFIHLRSVCTACEDWCMWQNTWVMMSTVISAVAAIIIISSMKWHGALIWSLNNLSQQTWSTLLWGSRKIIYILKSVGLWDLQY